MSEGFMARVEWGNDAYGQERQSLVQSYLYQGQIQFNLKYMHLLAFLFLLLIFCSEALMFFAIICFKNIWFSFSFYFVFSGKPRKTYLKLRKTNGAPLGGTFKGAPVISWVILFLVQGIQVLVINLSVWWSVSVDLKIFEFLSSSIESQISSQLYVSVWKTMMSLWRFKSLFTHLR